MRIDLNADMGEGFGAWRMGQDEALLGAVTSANVACGFHAGDATIMRELTAAANARGVAVGAHPGFDDKWGFGRRAISMNARDLEYMVAYQIGALQALAAYSGAALRHVKPHGALYTMAAKDADYARAIASAVRTVDARLILVGLPGLRDAKGGGCGWPRLCARRFLRPALSRRWLAHAALAAGRRDRGRGGGCAAGAALRPRWRSRHGLGRAAET